MEKTLYDIYLNRDQNKMVRCDYENETFTHDEVLKTYKEDYFFLGNTYGWEYVKTLLIIKSVDSELIKTAQYDDIVNQLPEGDTLKLIRSMSEILETDVIKKVDLDFPDDYVKKLWNESELVYISTHSSDEKVK